MPIKRLSMNLAISLAKIQCFGCHNGNKAQNAKCHTLLSSLFNFQSIGIQTWKFLIFHIFRKKGRCTPLQKVRKLVKKKNDSAKLR